MTVHPVYDQLLAEITDELERKVLQVLIDHAGTRVTRPQLVMDIFGIEVEQAELTGNYQDRQIRECIEHLQKRDYPIMASSGTPGYVLAADETVLDAYIAEIGSRIANMQEKQSALRRSRRWIGFIRQWKEGRPAQQISMFGKV
jgi:hypothetical protein